MTQPRIVRPGDIVFSTARTVARFYLLRPDPVLVQATGYLLGHYAKVHGVLLCGVCMMSTHLHLVYQDCLGRGPAFLRDVHRGIANVVKALRGWSGSVFAERPNQVRLLTPEAVADKLGYTAANPRAAGAVRFVKEWPGLCSRPDRLSCGAKRYKRPKVYFREAGGMPEEAELKLELPSVLVEHYGEEQAKALLAQSFAEHLERADAEMKAQGWTYLGAERCLKVSPYKRSKAYEVFGDREPSFAVKGGGSAAFRAAVAELRSFRQAYREAMAHWRERKWQVCFPFGTYLMKLVHGVSVSPAPS